MKSLIVGVAIEVGATGLLLIIDPELVTRLVFGGELSDLGQGLAQLGGLILVLLAIACWPTRAEASTSSTLHAMLVYNLVASGYLFHMGVAGKLVGVLLWPVAALHAVLTIVLAYASLGRIAL
jgi:hypothetical protein